MFTQNHALKGVNLWAIAYTQTVDLEPGSETLDDLITVASTWDLYPRDDGADLGDEPEATDTQTLEGAG